MKKYVRRSLVFLIAILIIIGTFNLFMDPFWCFSHNHRFNSVQKGTNERQQKANYIFFTTHQYDTLLLGSSRTTYMNRHSFKGMNVFNFSASGMRPQEYATYINFIIHDTKQPIETIILGMDFFGYLNYGSFMYDNAPYIVNTTKTPYYRWKILLSFDALNNSIKNMRDYLNPEKHTDRYNRDNVKNRVKIPITSRGNEQIETDVRIYAHEEYSSLPNPNFNLIIRSIKEDHSDKKFILYTTPISEPLFRELIRKGHYTHYENWLRNLVSVYGRVHHFMYINSVSKNYLEYFADSNHAYPETNELIAHKITLPADPKIPHDFGIILTPKNIEEVLNHLRIINGITTQQKAKNDNAL